MDEPKRKVDRKTPGGAPGEGQEGWSAPRRSEPEWSRSVSVVEVREPQDATASGSGKDLQARPQSSLNIETPTTDRQRRFVKRYLSNGKDCVDAYSYVTKKRQKKLPQASLKKLARDTLKSAGVQYLLGVADDHKHTNLEPVFKKYGINEAKIAEELAKIAFSDPTQVMSWDGTKVDVKPSDTLSDDVKGTIAEVRPTRDGVVVKQHDKVGALLTLGKALGMFREDKQEAPKMAVQFIINKKD